MGSPRAASRFVNWITASAGMPTDSGEDFSNVSVDMCFLPRFVLWVFCDYDIVAIEAAIFHHFGKNCGAILGTQAAGLASIIS